VATAGVSWATCAIVQRDGSRTSPASGRSSPAQEREQARLAAAVRADQADLLPGVEGERRVLEQPVRAARERQVVEAEHPARRSKS